MIGSGEFLFMFSFSILPGIVLSIIIGRMALIAQAKPNLIAAKPAAYNRRSGRLCRAAERIGMKEFIEVVFSTVGVLAVIAIGLAAMVPYERRRNGGTGLARASILENTTATILCFSVIVGGYALYLWLDMDYPI